MAAPKLKYATIDDSGYIVNTSSFAKVPPYVVKAISDIKKRIIERLPDNVRSIYLRGSIPLGFYDRTVSDIDLLFVLNDKESPEIVALQQELTIEFGQYFTTIDIIASDTKDIETYPVIAFIIKTQAILLFGEHFENAISDFNLTDQIAFNLDILESSVLEFLTQVDRACNDAKALCRWIMKIIIRSAFELNMTAEKRYTRDLYTCYCSFCKFCPERKMQLKKCLELVINPIDDYAQIASIVSDIGFFIVEKHKCKTKVVK